MYELVKNLTNGLCTVVFLSKCRTRLKPRCLETRKDLDPHPRLCR